MSDLVVLGTDTAGGKTTFCLMWMAAFAEHYDYWKPLQTGPSDSAAVRRLVPSATVHEPLLAFQQPVAPLLAARQENMAIPAAVSIAAARPKSARPLLVETFGGPFSPLNEEELQVQLVHALRMPCVLIGSTNVGAIGRGIQCLRALAGQGIVPVSIVLVGPRDPFAEEQVARHWQGGKVYWVQPPAVWDESGIAAAANAALGALLAVRSLVAGGERQPPESCQAVGSPSPVARQIVERDRLAVWHPYTPLAGADDPLVCVGAHDEFLHLADGRMVIDAISSWWTILHSHRHPVLMAALQEAARHFDHVHFAGLTHEPAVELAELMLKTTPWPDGRVFYSDDGSTAVEVALKMAYQFWCHHDQPQRTRFIAFEHGYHGDTFGAMSICRDPLFFGRFEPLLFQASIVPLSVSQLDAELHRHASETAAVIIEPLVQGAGGMRMHTPAQLRELAEVARRHGVLLIVDEVMTAGRTGTLWAHTPAAIVPDLISAGKTLAGGVLPLAATLAAPDIAEAFQTSDRSKTFFHGHSFTAHPLACAVAVANWKLLMPAVDSAARRMEEFWLNALAPLRALPCVSDVRVRGSIAAVELHAEGGYLATVARQIRNVCLERGVLIRPLGNVVYAMPPLMTSHESLQAIAGAIVAAC